jgi:CHASE2 domain-containing sensor protein
MTIGISRTGSTKSGPPERGGKWRGTMYCISFLVLLACLLTVSFGKVIYGGTFSPLLPCVIIIAFGKIAFRKLLDRQPSTSSLNIL